MNKIFLAYPFTPRAGKAVHDFVNNIGRIIDSHGLVTITGGSLGGTQLTPAIQQRIAECDALIAVFTREDKIAGKNAWRAKQWVEGELALARNRNQRAIAVIEKGVQTAGPYAENESIALALADPAEAYLRLSETIGLWKEEAGRFLLVRLLPEQAANLAGNGNVECKFRLVPPQGPAGTWQTGTVRVQPGGVFLAIPGLKDGMAIDVELNAAGQVRWRSGEFPQWVHVELRAVP